MREAKAKHPETGDFSRDHGGLVLLTGLLLIGLAWFHLVPKTTSPPVAPLTMDFPLPCLQPDLLVSIQSLSSKMPLACFRLTKINWHRAWLKSLLHFETSQSRPPSSAQLSALPSKFPQNKHSLSTQWHLSWKSQTLPQPPEQHGQSGLLQQLSFGLLEPRASSTGIAYEVCLLLRLCSVVNKYPA